MCDECAGTRVHLVTCSKYGVYEVMPHPSQWLTDLMKAKDKDKSLDRRTKLIDHDEG